MEDLNKANYQSSSSGNSSPARDPEPKIGINVEEIDMWDVLDCLEGARATIDPLNILASPAY